MFPGTTIIVDYGTVRRFPPAERALLKAPAGLQQGPPEAPPEDPPEGAMEGKKYAICKIRSRSRRWVVIPLLSA